MIEMTGVESKIEGLIQVLNEGENPILEVCRSGKMTMRRGHHTSSVLRAMGAKENAAAEIENQVLEAEEGAVVEPE
jgi:acetolactate synthase-1/3 small subunit